VVRLNLKAMSQGLNERGIRDSTRRRVACIVGGEHVCARPKNLVVAGSALINFACNTPLDPRKSPVIMRPAGVTGDATWQMEQ
jgi:hypothetical protein